MPPVASQCSLPVCPVTNPQCLMLPVLLDRPEGSAPPYGSTPERVRRLSRGSDHEVIVLDLKAWILPGGENSVRGVGRLRLPVSLLSADGKTKIFEAKSFNNTVSLLCTCSGSDQTANHGGSGGQCIPQFKPDQQSATRITISKKWLNSLLKKFARR